MSNIRADNIKKGLIHTRRKRYSDLKINIKNVNFRYL